MTYVLAMITGALIDQAFMFWMVRRERQINKEFHDAAQDLIGVLKIQITQLKSKESK